MLSVLVWTEGLNTSKCKRFQEKTQMESRASVWVFSTKLTSRRSPLMKRRSYTLDRVAIIIKFDSINRVMMAKKSAKKCAARLEFLFCLFSRFLHDCGCAELASNFTTLSNPWYATIWPEKSTTWWKTRHESDVLRYPYKGSKYVSTRLSEKSPFCQLFKEKRQMSHKCPEGRASFKLTLPLRMVIVRGHSHVLFLLCNFTFKVIDYISQISRKWVKLQK